MQTKFKAKLIDLINEIQSDDREAFLQVFFKTYVEYTIISENLTIYSWNNGASKLYGFLPSETIGANLLSFIPFSQHNLIKKALAIVEKKGKWSGEIERVCKNNTVVKTHLDVLPYYRPTKKNKFILISRLTGEEKSENTKLNSEVELLKTLLESSNQYAVIGIDPNKKIVEWNKAAGLLFGFKSKDALNMSFYDLPCIKGLSKKAFQEFFKEVEKNGEAVHIFEFHNNQGEFMIVSFIMAVRKDVNNNPLGYVLICKNITTEKEFEAQLKKKNVVLQDFSVLVSHDLKAPLRAINNLSSWIIDDPKTRLSSEAEKHFNMLLDRTNAMGRLIDNILAYSRAGSIHFYKKKVNIAILLENVIKQIDPPKSFVIKLVNKMPTFELAETPLSQVFANLINNSFRHHHKKSGKIKIGVKDQGKCFEFFVKDDGPGLGLEDPNSIFDLNRIAQGSGGFGLGIIKRIVEANGGTIKVESSNKGTIFYFTWPKG